MWQRGVATAVKLGIMLGNAQHYHLSIPSIHQNAQRSDKKELKNENIINSNIKISKILRKIKVVIKYCSDAMAMKICFVAAIAADA